MKKRLFAMTGVFALAMVGAMFVAPACKAQAEINPDHFDGTDAWAAAPQTAHKAKPTLRVAKATVRPQNSTASTPVLANAKQAQTEAVSQRSQIRAARSSGARVLAPSAKGKTEATTVRKEKPAQATTIAQLSAPKP